MKLILLSDVHLSSKTPIGRLDDYRKTCLRKFEYVLKYAQKINAMILQAGDLFDKPRDWFILIDLNKMLKKYKYVLNCAYGQHDTYMYSVENRVYTSMGVLWTNDLINVLSEEPQNFGFALNCDFYGASFNPNLTIPKIVDKKKTNILVIHGTISDQAIYPGQQFYLAEQFLKDHKNFDLILCADIHRHFHFKSNDRHLVNTGPMMRKEATAYNFTHKPCFYVYDTETKKLTKETIPHEPAEQVLSRKHIESSAEADTMLETFIAAVNDTDMAVGADLVDNIHAFLRKNKIEKTVCDILEEVMSRHNKEAE